MIDYDDVDDATWFALIMPAGGILIAAVIIALLVAAVMNDKDCSRMTCPSGARPTLMAHDCLCVTPAK